MILRLITLTALVFCLSCNEDYNSESDTPLGNFNALWQFVDENYVYIDYKNLDLEELKDIYASQISDNTSNTELFKICSNFVLELKDGHCFLRDGAQTIRYNAAENFDTFFDLDMIKDNYLDEPLVEYQYLTTGIINDTTAYLHINDFKDSEEYRTAMSDFIANQFNKFIVDVRDNSGGDPDVALHVASSFMEEDIFLGQMIHKNGKAHNDFTEPIDIFSYELSSIAEDKVKLLTNIKSFSASSYLAGMLQHRDNVEIIGQTTRGGGGEASSIELPNGWIVGVTVNFFLDAEGNHIENGVDPDIEINNTQEEIENGFDAMLEEAISR